MKRTRNLCPLCQSVKKPTEFTWRNNGKYRQPYCKECTREYAKIRYANSQQRQGRNLCRNSDTLASIAPTTEQSTPTLCVVR